MGSPPDAGMLLAAAMVQSAITGWPRPCVAKPIANTEASSEASIRRMFHRAIPNRITAEQCYFQSQQMHRRGSHAHAEAFSRLRDDLTEHCVTTADIQRQSTRQEVRLTGSRERKFALSCLPNRAGKVNSFLHFSSTLRTSADSLRQQRATFGFRVVKLCAHDGNRNPFGSSENHCHAAAGACSVSHWPGGHCTSAPEGVQLSRRPQNGHLDVRMNFPAPQRARHTRRAGRAACLTAAGRSDRSVRSRERDLCHFFGGQVARPAATASP